MATEKIIDNTNLGYLWNKIKAAFWSIADVVNINLADVAVTGEYDDILNRPTFPALTVADITALTGAQIDALNNGDVVAEETGTQIDSYIAVIKDATVGKFSLVYVDHTTVKEVIYIKSGGAWTYDSTETLQVAVDISTDLLTDKNSNTKVAGAKAAYDEIHPATQSAQPAGGFLPNVLYVLGTVTGSVTFALATPPDAGVTNHYYWTFDTGASAPTVTWPASITGWQGGAPTIYANKHYEVSVLNNIATIMEV